MRKPIIAGNWKMNKTLSETKELISKIIPLVKDAKTTVVVCPPFVNLAEAKKALEGTNIGLGAQNMHFEASGAFTGEVSAQMLKEIGVQYVIIGHSERRQYFNETDEGVGKKAAVAVANGLTPIICVGESLSEREAEKTNDIICPQTKKALANLTTEQAKDVVIAYEPIWAIGTGKTATKEQANDAIIAIRGAVRELFGAAADEIRIQYGGSMNAANADELMGMSDIDGGLIGGAALKEADFAAIVKAADNSL